MNQNILILSNEKTMKIYLNFYFKINMKNYSINFGFIL